MAKKASGEIQPGLSPYRRRPIFRVYSRGDVVPAIHQLETRACAAMFMYKSRVATFRVELRSGLMEEDGTRRGMRDRRKFSRKFFWIKKIDLNALSIIFSFLFSYIFQS